MGTYYKQIAVYKTTKTLLEFVDDTRYDTEIMAWPHLRNSRIRIGVKDYSKGVGENARDAFYNLSPEEFIRLIEGICAVKQVSAVEKKRWDVTMAKLTQLTELYKRTAMPQQSVDEIRDLIEQFKASPNEIFSEAGEKLSTAFEGLIKQFSSAQSTGMTQTDKMLSDTKKERDAAVKVREIFGDIKILNFEKYINPNDAKERRVTAIRVSYAGQMDYPYLFEVSNGWGKPKITRNNGVMIEEGSVHFDDVIQVRLQEKHLFPLLRRVEMFLRAMTTQGMQKYFERVSDPILNESVEE